MENCKAYIANSIFTGETWLTDYAILVANDRIKDIVPQQEIPSGSTVHHFENSILSPAFIDIQIYGAHGLLLSEHPTSQALQELNAYCNHGGAAWCLPTVATNSNDVFKQAIDAIKTYWKHGGKGILGIHLEGPWLNPMKKGAHMESFIHIPTVTEVKELLAYGEGVIKMITMAPEQCSPHVIQCIRDAGIVLSAGHSNATYAQAKEGFAHGITAVTHLYNAMSALQHREPGLVGATMDDDVVMASIIPDGYHVDYAAIRIAKATMKDRLFVITDAVTRSQSGPYQHELAGDKYESAGILSGSALTMHKAVLNLVNHCGIELGEAIRMCSLYPAKVLRLDHALGKIEKGYHANLVAIHPLDNTCTLIEH